MLVFLYTFKTMCTLGRKQDFLRKYTTQMSSIDDELKEFIDFHLNKEIDPTEYDPVHVVDHEILEKNQAGFQTLNTFVCAKDDENSENFTLEKSKEQSDYFFLINNYYFMHKNEIQEKSLFFNNNLEDGEKFEQENLENQLESLKNLNHLADSQLHFDRHLMINQDFELGDSKKNYSTNNQKTHWSHATEESLCSINSKESSEIENKVNREVLNSSTIMNSTESSEYSALEEIDTDDLFFTNKIADPFNMSHYMSDLSSEQKLGSSDLEMPDTPNDIHSEFSSSISYILLNPIASCTSNLDFPLKENNLIKKMIYKNLQKLTAYLELDKTEINDSSNVIAIDHYIKMINFPFNEQECKNQSYLDLFTDKIKDFFEIVINFDIEKSQRFTEKNYTGFPFVKQLYICDNEDFLQHLKRTYSLINHKNTYSYLLVKFRTIFLNIPDCAIARTCFFSEIIKKTERIYFRYNELAELNTIYSLLKFKKFEKNYILLIYFYVSVMFMMLDSEVKNKKDRIYICYNSIFLILKRNLGRNVNLISDTALVNPYLSMCLVSNDVICKYKRRRLHLILQGSLEKIHSSLLINRSLLNHIFFSLEIIFVNKVLDDYEVEDESLRKECGDILKNKLKRYFNKYKKLNSFSLIKASIALHHFIIKKDTVLLDNLID